MNVINASRGGFPFPSDTVRYVVRHKRGVEKRGEQSFRGLGVPPRELR